MITPLVCDLTGRSQTWLWLLHTFGRVQVHAALPRRGRPVYRITRLSAGVTGQLLTATVLDEEGRPLPHSRVVRAYTRASASTCALDATTGLGDDVAPTDDQGLAEFPTRGADLYTLPACGRSTLWIADRGPSLRGAPSDAVSGIGILQSDLGLRLCLHITLKRICGPASRTFPSGGPVLSGVEGHTP